MFDLIPSTIAHVRSGQLRVLAITTAARSPILPDTPPLSEAAPGYEASAIFGLGAPRGTPVDIIAKLNAAINAALADADMKPRFDAFGSDPLILSPEGYATLLARDVAKWRKAVETSGAQVN